MGLFTPFGKNNRKVTEYEYDKQGSGGIRNRIMSRLSGSFSEKQKKMAELDNALRPSMDSGGRTKYDDGIDAHEAEETFGRLEKNDAHLSLNKNDIEAAREELEKGI